MQGNKLLTDDKSIRQAVMVEQIKMLIAQSPTGIVMGFLLASFIALVFGELVPGRFVFAWWCIISTFFFCQYLMYLTFTKQRADQVNHRRWYYMVLAAAAISGLCWGVGLTLMLREAPPQFHIFLIILLISLAAAGITMAIRTPVYYTFAACILMPVITWLAVQEEIIKFILGMFLIIFMVAMWLFAYQVNRALFTSLRLQLENQSLANSLKQSNARLQVLNEELTQLSATDSLTQVANRRYFDNRILSEFSRASREHTALSIIMIDVDFFKVYNDKLGHIAGDECLRQVALCIRNSLKRPTDLVARFGGEEFVVLLPSTAPEGALSLAEEIRENVESINIEHPDSKASKYVTISLGVTGGYPSRDYTKEMMLKKADEALYNAKADGRNRVHYEPVANRPIQRQA